ncbi:hypothetical protein [Nocardioides sp.]|uniref:hypothetical protein n=1 Tax=Nocardioides sp. TaxID=35761 RepID=UPI00261C2381|nr:hypothetical protein [Nocardioides sp.]
MTHTHQGEVDSIRRYQTTPEPSFYRRAGQDILRARWQRPEHLAALCTPLILCLLLGIIEGFAPYKIALLALMLLVVLGPLQWWGQASTLGKQVRRVLPPTVAVRTEFDGAFVTIIVADLTVRVPCRRLVGVRRSGAVVLFDGLPGLALVALPAAVFPDEEISRLRSGQAPVVARK